MANQYLEEGRRFSEERIARIKEEIEKIGELKDKAEIVIYATGSYGRLEATRRSDLDLFIIHRDTDQSSVPLPQSAQAIIRAEIVQIGRRVRLPDFSGDGEYLAVHSLKAILTQLGGRHDDSLNHFTARLLLLLESRPLFNEAAYETVLSEIIEAYFRDFHDHEEDFKPIFLVNDILRFWKTLCLNYENRRNIPTGDPAKKSKVYLKNLKLKFSLLLTCFSTVIPLSAAPNTTPEEIKALVSLPPLKRLELQVGGDQNKEKVYKDIVDIYVVPRASLKG
jgi:hypothetical protein